MSPQLLDFSGLLDACYGQISWTQRSTKLEALRCTEQETNKSNARHKRGLFYEPFREPIDRRIFVVLLPARLSGDDTAEVIASYGAFLRCTRHWQIIFQLCPPNYEACYCTRLSKYSVDEACPNGVLQDLSAASRIR